MAKLRHIAISVPNVEKAARFYEKAFGMSRIGKVDGQLAKGIYLSDGTMNLAVLRYKTDAPMGDGKTKDWFGVHHIGFWVDDPVKQRKAIEKAGGRWYMGEVNNGGYYEVKFADPFGNIVDISHNGWGGAVKDGPAPAGTKPRAKRVTRARKVIAAKAPTRKAPTRKAAAARAVTKRTAPKRRAVGR